ncbi:transcriptional regulator PpsR, partial [Roseibium denhamense]
LGGEALAAIVGMGSDVVHIVGEDGVVQHVHYNDPGLEPYGLPAMVGKRLRDCVTHESVPKIDAMLSPSQQQRPERGYQINHRANGHPDLPVAYKAFPVPGAATAIVVGREMQRQMRDQQRLVEAQIAMEADYRDLRQAEARYRTAFKVSETAYVMLEGDKRTILEANAAAIALLESGSANLTGKAVRDLVAKQERDRLGDAIGEARHSGEPVLLPHLMGAKGVQLGAKLRAYRENGATNLILTLWPAQDSEQSARHLSSDARSTEDLELGALPEAALRTDQEGNLLAANALFLDLVHAPTLNQVLGRNVSDWIGKSAIDISVLYARIIEEKRIRSFNTVLSDTLGSEHPVLLSGYFDPEADVVHLLVLPQSAQSDAVSIQPGTTQDQAEGFASLVGKVPLKELIRESLDVVEKICIEAALDQTNNNRANAAEILGLSRQSLYIKLRRHGLENYRPGS